MHQLRSLAQPRRKHTLSRITDLYANSSEGRLSALPVEMCMAQHLSLRGFLAFTAIGANVLTSLIPPLAQKKSIAIPPAQHLAVRRWTGF